VSTTSLLTLLPAPFLAKWIFAKNGQGVQRTANERGSDHKGDRNMRVKMRVGDHLRAKNREGKVVGEWRLWGAILKGSKSP